MAEVCPSNPAGVLGPEALAVLDRVTPLLDEVYRTKEVVGIGFDATDGGKRLLELNAHPHIPSAWELLERDGNNGGQILTNAVIEHQPDFIDRRLRFNLKVSDQEDDGALRQAAQEELTHQIGLLDRLATAHEIGLKREAEIKALERKPEPKGLQRVWRALGSFARRLIQPVGEPSQARR